MMANKHRERILILAKTYPSPSAQYTETSCVAGINEQGTTRRLYPVPFRLIEQNQQFKKWQWIEAIIEKSNSDHRPESHKIDIGTLLCQNVISTEGNWYNRRQWLEKLPTLQNIHDLNSSRTTDQLSIALLKPTKVQKLEIRKARNQDWTQDEKDKLLQAQMQGSLFSEDDAKQQIRDLRKVPFDFYYHYQCTTPNGIEENCHKLVDWEVMALFWRCQKSHGSRWEQPFRQKIESELPRKDLMFLMGNQHRFQDQWLIISLIYPPKQMPVEDVQIPLF